MAPYETAMTASEELHHSLHTLRTTLAKKRAERKNATNSQLRALEVVSHSLAAESNPLLDQSFRAYSVLERLNALDAERDASAFGASLFVEASPSEWNEELNPELAAELAAFQIALRS